MDDHKFYAPTYRLHEDWVSLPQNLAWGTISSVACDSQDRVYVYHRGKNPLIVFDRDGNFLKSWGEGVVTEAHGIHIDGKDTVYCTDRKAHCVYILNKNLDLVMTLGVPGMASGEGIPFNQPTDIAVSSKGEVFISDGYGNRCVHKFSSTGKHISTWGREGIAKGEFALPHGLSIDNKDRVWVCDRTNNRIQIFSDTGVFLDEWTGLHHPDMMCFNGAGDMVFVAELDFQVSIFTIDGKLITQWGGGQSSGSPGEFLGWPHGICMDSHGDLYVCEVNTVGRIQKFKCEMEMA